MEYIRKLGTSTEKGLAQANELAEGMDKYSLDMIFSV